MNSLGSRNRITSEGKFANGATVNPVSLSSVPLSTRSASGLFVQNRPQLYGNLPFRVFGNLKFSKTSFIWSPPRAIFQYIVEPS